MRKKYKRLLFDDRKKIEKMVSEGKDTKEIAERIGVHTATIYNELRRCAGKYNAEQAQNSL